MTSNSKFGRARPASTGVRRLTNPETSNIEHGGRLTVLETRGAGEPCRVWFRYRAWLGGLSALVASLGNVACARSVEVAVLGEQSGSSADAGCEVRQCQGRVFACGDCEDNDRDGLADAQDPDCWGACHDSEENWAPRQICSNDSCFFDNDCGLGNDAECAMLTPNGCDCHGCCVVSGAGRTVSLGTVDESGNSSCGASSVDDATACAACAIDEACLNACDPGEMCF